MQLNETDPKIASLINAEEQRQATYINLIPSENIASQAVREAVGSVLMHKYAEGNVGKRYYEGNWFIDEVEQLAINRAAELFRIPADWGVNVQALSGSNANLSVYIALLQPGDKILSMNLTDGGHLSHGWKANFTSKIFEVQHYNVDPETQLLDYEELAKLANSFKPTMIITGGTAYPRDIDYTKVKAIAESVGALYLADIAHEAGLVAAGVLPSPVGVADVVTMTTHKTLRAARGAIILSSQENIAKINKAVLPGLQGGPFMNNIVGIAVGLHEALQPEFKQYAKRVIANAKELGNQLSAFGFQLVTGGTDKHLILIDLTNKNISGKRAAKALAAAGIIVNMNTMPGETRSPLDPSAIRIGTPFVTTQGLREEHMAKIARWINEVIEVAREIKADNILDFIVAIEKDSTVQKIKSEIKVFMHS